MPPTLAYLFRGEVGGNFRLERGRCAVPDERWFTSLQWHQATSIEVRFEAMGDRTQQGSVITRDDAWGAHSGVGAGGGAVALMELLSGYSTLPEGAPLSSCRYGKVRVWRYTEALDVLRQVVLKAGDDPSEVALHSSHIDAASPLAAAGEVAWRMI